MPRSLLFVSRKCKHDQGNNEKFAGGVSSSGKACRTSARQAARKFASNNVMAAETDEHEHRRTEKQKMKRSCLTRKKLKKACQNWNGSDDDKSLHNIDSQQGAPQMQVMSLDHDKENMDKKNEAKELQGRSSPHDPHSNSAFAVQAQDCRGKPMKTWKCDMCNRVFSHQYTLMRHVPTHTNERKFKCDVCKKAFRQASTLSRHKAIHSEARPFACTTCGKAFNRSSTLILHKKTHSLNKSYICSICGKGFHQKGNLKNHMHTHTNERPYKCSICGRGFNQMSNLMCHRSHAHVEKPKHKCRLCEKEFPKRFSLRSHEEYKHGIKFDSSGEILVTCEKSQVKEFRQKRGRPLNGSACRTVTLPNGDKTIKFFHDSKEGDDELNNCTATSSTNGVFEKPNRPVTMRQQSMINVKKVKPPVSRNMHPNVAPMIVDTHAVTTAPKISGIIVPSIRIPALQATSKNGNAAVALFKPEDGITTLVKVLTPTDNVHILIPATAEDLHMAGKGPAEIHGTHDMQVPIIATIALKLDTNGQVCFEVEKDTQSNVVTTHTPVLKMDIGDQLMEKGSNDSMLTDAAQVASEVELKEVDPLTLSVSSEVVETTHIVEESSTVMLCGMLDNIGAGYEIVDSGIEQDEEMALLPSAHRVSLATTDAVCDASQTASDSTVNEQCSTADDSQISTSSLNAASCDSASEACSSLDLVQDILDVTSENAILTTPDISHVVTVEEISNLIIQATSEMADPVSQILS